jgi:hypothetical protein
MNIIKNQWEVLPISHKDVVDFVSKHHYAKGCANTSVARFGLFYQGDRKTIHGVSMWMPPIVGAGKKVCDNHRVVLGLSRFCLHDDRPDNSGSFLLSRSVQLLDKERWKVMLTYADSAKGHTGGLYRASNWFFHGKTNPARIYTDPNTGVMVSKKAGPINRSHKEMIDLGYEASWSDGKYRFIMPSSRRVRGKVLNIQPENRKGLFFTADGKLFSE